MSMKASGTSAEGSSIAIKERLTCLSLIAGLLAGSCSDAKGLDPIPQNDTLYALPAGVTVEVRETFQLGAQRVKGGVATNVSDKVMWVSSDPNVVTIDAAGKGTATGIGAAEISTSYEGFPAKVNVKVNGRITSAEVEAAVITLAKGTSYRLATTGIVEDFSKRVLPAGQAWGTSNATVATVSADGTVSAKAAGSATISLTFKNAVYPRTVSVVDVPLEKVDYATDNGVTVATGQRTTFRAVGTFMGGMTQNISNLFTASFSTEDGEFATVSGVAVTAVSVPKGTTEKVVTAIVSGNKGTIAEGQTKSQEITLVDAKSLSSLAFVPALPTSTAANAEPFTPTFKGTYGSFTDVPTTAPTLSFKGANADDKTKYVELISGAVYPRIAGSCSIIGTVNVPVDGSTTPKAVTASSDLQIVGDPLASVTLASRDMTTTVTVDKSIRLSATANYGSLTQDVTSAAVWISANPSIALVANAAGSFGTPGRVTGVSPGDVDIEAYYRGKSVGKVPVTVVPVQ